MGSTRHRHAVVFAYITPRDHVRVKALAADYGVTISKFITVCIDDHMEQFGLEPLEMLASRGRPRKAEAS